MAVAVVGGPGWDGWWQWSSSCSSGLVNTVQRIGGGIGVALLAQSVARSPGRQGTACRQP